MSHGLGEGKFKQGVPTLVGPHLPGAQDTVRRVGRYSLRSHQRSESLDSPRAGFQRPTKNALSALVTQGRFSGSCHPLDALPIHSRHSHHLEKNATAFGGAGGMSREVLKFSMNPLFTAP